MNSELSIALIASITSLVVAVISLINSLTTSRMAAQSSNRLEALRAQYARRSTQEQFIDTQLKESLDSLHNALQAIQRVRDELQLILTSEGTTLSADLAIQYVRTARQELFSCYEEHMARLSDTEVRILHTAKNRALVAENIIVASLTHQEYSSALTEQDRPRLIEIRSQLNEAQQLLRDSRSHRVLSRYGETALSFVVGES